ncbi:MAG: universal stress protein [Phycisphaerales bacterium]
MPNTTQIDASTLRTIVVSTDFSNPARRAIEWAIAIASAHQARIVLVHAMPVHAPGGADFERAMHDATIRKLREASEPIVEAKLAMTTDCRIGKPYSVICDAARDAGADLIVIGSRGLTGLDRFLLGSTADRVLRTASVPVLTVHPDDPRPQVRHVMFATDFSASSKVAMSASMRLLSAFTPPVRLTMLHVSVPPYVVGGIDIPMPLVPDWDKIDREARRELDATAEAARSDRVQVTADIVRGQPAPVIIDEARSRHVDIIALGTHGATGLDRLLLGSIAERVLHHAPCPVLTTRIPWSEEDDRRLRT